MRTRLLVGFVSVLGLTELEAQLHPEPRVTATVQLIRTPAWSLRETTGSFLNRQASFDARTTIGIELGFSPTPLVQLFGGFDTDLGGFGDDSGYSLVEGGLAIRPLRRLPAVPFGVASYGRMSESGGVSFGVVTVGAGVDIPVRRAVAIRGAVRRLIPTGEPRSSRPAPGLTATVDAEMTRLHLGVSLRF